MSVMFIAGFAVGILLVALAFWVVRRKMKMKPCEYDERQELLRGRGFKYAFFFLMIYEFIAGVMEMEDTFPWCDSVVINSIGICLSLLVFVSYCIWEDAYISLTEKPVKVCIFLGLAATLNGVIGAVNLVSGTLKGEGGLQAINLILAVVLLIVMIELIVKISLSKREME